jgi:hypothetical protein
MKIGTNTIIGTLCILNGVRIIALKVQNAKLEKRLSERTDELIDAEGKRDSIVSEWYLNKKISHDMYYEYCDRRNKKDD